MFNTTITDMGALNVSSGLKTGRTPKEKRVVEDETTKDVRMDVVLCEICRLYGGVM